ncbi:hypothetical protein V2J09_007475 [Rumex salicifolius]
MANENPAGEREPAELEPSGVFNNDHNKKQQKENGRKRRISRLVPKFGCFRSDFDIPSLERQNVDGSTDMVSATFTGDNRAPSPSHLVIMINGIIGSAKNWRYGAKQFVKKHPQEVVVHCSRCNHSTLTFDGVDVMGRRLVREVISVIELNPSVKKISFIAHSLGGLVVRYAIALLYETNYLKLFPTENGEEGNKGSTIASIEEKYRGKIAGLEPVNYVTFATPHLGSMGHNQVPLFCGLKNLEKLARRSSWLLGRTGKHLFLTDSENEKPPLLLQMSSDFEDLPFISALQSFKRRIAYANVRFDQIVGWCTSSIRYPSELPRVYCTLKSYVIVTQALIPSHLNVLPFLCMFLQRSQLSRHEIFKHVVNREPPKVSIPKKVYSQETIVDGWKNLTTEEMIEIMLNGLTKLSWERVDVKFNGVQIYWIHSAGVDVKKTFLSTDKY